MQKEKRHLIIEEGNKLLEEYEKQEKSYKEHGNLDMAISYAMMQNAVLQYQLNILTLDQEGKI